MSTSPPVLLFGPYRPPALEVGDRATCLFFGREVVVLAWSDGPIPWPLSRQASPHAVTSVSGPRQDVLARAIRAQRCADETQQPR
jgi:hypothetical protein